MQLVAFERGRDRNVFGVATAAPLAKSAVAVVTGGTLFHTLMLNALPYSRDEGRSSVWMDGLSNTGKPDSPAWEQDEVTQPVQRQPRGYLDLLTWQSRRILLHPIPSIDGEYVVRRAVLMKGWQFTTDFAESRHRVEPMVAFRKLSQSGNRQEVWVPAVFQRDRSLWRDSLALLQSVAGDGIRPRNVEWVNDLIVAGRLNPSKASPVRLELFGMLSDRAKPILWRHERMPLPSSYLDNGPLLDALKLALGLAESVDGVLRTSVLNLAKRVHQPGQAVVVRPAADLDVVKRLAARLDPRPAYWSRLEIPFKRLVVRLGSDVSSDDEGGVKYGMTCLPEWTDAVRRAARVSFGESLTGLVRSARTMRAAAEAEDEFNSRLFGALNGRVVANEREFWKEDLTDAANGIRAQVHRLT